MGLDILNPAGANTEDITENMIEAEAFDIESDRRQSAQAFAASPELDRLTSTIDVNDLNSIITFGADAAENISKVSDTVLRSISMAEIGDSGRMFASLGGIMEKFDINELNGGPSILGKLFGGAQKKLDRILDKYRTMGDEVDKIYIQLKQYEAEIKRSNDRLEAMFRASLDWYHELVKYIVAGEQGCREIQQYMDELGARFGQTGEQTLRFELQSLSQAKNMLEMRTQDLRTAEAVAMQSLPMLKTMQFNNMNLVRKINSAFIVTLPVFKQALAQAILLKRQRLQAQALSALDARANEMLLKNAKAGAEQARLSSKLGVGVAAVQAETLENTRRTIMEGIDETRRLQKRAETQRAEDMSRLQKIKRDFEAGQRAAGGR